MTTRGLFHEKKSHSNFFFQLKKSSKQEVSLQLIKAFESGLAAVVVVGIHRPTLIFHVVSPPSSASATPTVTPSTHASASNPQPRPRPRVRVSPTNGVDASAPENPRRARDPRPAPEYRPISHVLAFPRAFVLARVVRTRRKFARVVRGTFSRRARIASPVSRVAGLARRARLSPSRRRVERGRSRARVATRAREWRRARASRQSLVLRVDRDSDERAFAISMVNRYTHRPYMNAEVLEYLQLRYIKNVSK